MISDVQGPSTPSRATTPFRLGPRDLTHRNGLLKPARVTPREVVKSFACAQDDNQR